ncbi:MAG: hypothetical protein VR73_11245 [Gammaproteobacteria bacterium BRH_c0]|nr:MAG: hypothetical protein VR73_11245 [Gammaproteobacteria bacterium BRH_c0]
MTRRSLLNSRFDESEDEPLGALTNLLDIMLVFACGLIAALAMRSDILLDMQHQDGGQEVIQGTEIPDMPKGLGEAGSGYQSVGTVYRDPASGKLILVGE